MRRRISRRRRTEIRRTENAILGGVIGSIIGSNTRILISTITSDPIYNLTGLTVSIVASTFLGAYIGSKFPLEKKKILFHKKLNEKSKVHISKKDSDKLFNKLTKKLHLMKTYKQVPNKKGALFTYRKEYEK